MRLVIVYRTQLSMFFLHIIDLLLRPMFREMSSIWIQHVLNECGGADLNEIYGHNKGCFQPPGIVVRITFSLYLLYIRNNRNPKDSDFFQSCLFVSVKENIVQVTNPRSLILNVHDDRFFQNEPIASCDDGQRINPFQRLIGGGQMSRLAAISATNFDISCRCCKITMLQAWTLVNVIAILSNNGEIAAAITHHISDGT